MGLHPPQASPISCSCSFFFSGLSPSLSLSLLQTEREREREAQSHRITERGGGGLAITSLQHKTRSSSLVTLRGDPQPQPGR